jgi:hypothetical protein
MSIPFIINVDGQPNDRNSVKTTIIEATKKLSSQEELSITFIQIGNDSSAGDFLESLDDDLESMGAKFDIVDAGTFRILYSFLTNSNYARNGSIELLTINSKIDYGLINEFILYSRFPLVFSFFNGRKSYL